MNCPDCKARIGRDATECPECGYRIKAVRSKVCKNCGRYAEIGDYCKLHYEQIRPTTSIDEQMKNIPVIERAAGESWSVYIKRNMPKMLQPIPQAPADREPGSDDDIGEGEYGGCTCQAQGTCLVCRQWQEVM